VTAVDTQVFGPVRARRTFEAVVTQIAEAIRNGHLKQGDRLPSERLLAEQMEVSRPTLREAIAVLAKAGLVEVRPGSGGGTFVVSEVVPAALVEATESRLASIPAVLEARRALEPAIARLAAKNGDDSDFAEMERIVELQHRAIDDWAHVTRLDTRFHLQLARATKNPVLVATMISLSRQLEIARATRVDRSVSPESAVAVNEETLQALRTRDEQIVTAAMDKHLRLLEDAWADEAG
jgi:GntR family transcriptional regulator, transcriptional repressor for pyruvate dehydrogenase complex